jgi:Co/Zn/Cd efflux system component
MSDENQPAPALWRRDRRLLWFTALVALLSCVGELMYGHKIASDDVIKDGAEWLYDVGIYGLAALSLGQPKSIQQRAASVLVAIFVIGGLQGAYEVWDGLAHPTTDDAGNLMVTDIINILGSFAEAAVLLPFRISHDPLLEATWLSARNSVLTSVAGAGVTVICAIFMVQWPQTVIVVFGTLLSFQAAFVVGSDLKDVG